MGWSFHPHFNKRSDRRHLIQDLIQTEESNEYFLECLSHCVKGNVLWTVWERIIKETGEKKRFIGIDLLSFGGQDNGWGNKSLSESCGPYYYTCPVKYLEMVPCPDSEHAKLWREVVTREHLQRQTFRTVLRENVKKAKREGKFVRVKIRNAVIKDAIFSHFERANIFVHYRGSIGRLKKNMLGESDIISMDEMTPVEREQIETKVPIT